MRIRLRTVAALFALLALSLSTAGGAWAAMCDGGSAVAAAGSHEGTHHGHRAPEPPRSGDRDAPSCPLMLPGAAGSCLGAFVGAGLAARSSPADAVVHDFAPPRSTHGLLDPSPPFRPPEA